MKCKILIHESNTTNEIIIFTLLVGKSGEGCYTGGENGTERLV